MVKKIKNKTHPDYPLQLLIDFQTFYFYNIVFIVNSRFYLNVNLVTWDNSWD